MKEKICAECGHVGPLKLYTPGSMGTEVLLWLFILPGVIYSAWRLIGRYSGCSHCGAKAVIPLDSPRGRAIDRECRPPMPARPTERHLKAV